jgi:hypothetical protein
VLQEEKGGNNRCLFLESYETHKYTVGKNANLLIIKDSGT